MSRFFLLSKHVTIKCVFVTDLIYFNIQKFQWKNPIALCGGSTCDPNLEVGLQTHHHCHTPFQH